MEFGDLPKDSGTNWGGGYRTGTPLPSDCCVVAQEYKVFLTYEETGRKGTGQSREITYSYNGIMKKRVIKKCLAPRASFWLEWDPKDMDTRDVLSPMGMGVRWKKYKTEITCDSGNKGPEYQFQCGDEYVNFTNQQGDPEDAQDTGPPAMCLYQVKWKDCVKPCGDCECDLGTEASINGEITIKGDDVNLPLVGSVFNWLGAMAGNTTSQQFLDQLKDQINQQVGGPGEPSCECQLTSGDLGTVSSAGLRPVPALTAIADIVDRVGTTVGIAQAFASGNLDNIPNTQSRMCIIE